MKIALRYGLLITFGVAVWVVITQLLVPNPQSPIRTIGALAVFNGLQLGMIYLGILARGRELGDKVSFKDGIKTGVAISLVYAISSALFFTAGIIVVGTRMMASEPGAQTQPVWLVALGAFAGLILGALFLGLIYSTVVSFFLAKRQSGD